MWHKFLPETSIPQQIISPREYIRFSSVKEKNQPTLSTPSSSQGTYSEFSLTSDPSSSEMRHLQSLVRESR